MSKIKQNRTFIDLFETDRPILKVKFDVNAIIEATEVEIENRIEKNNDAKGLKQLEKLCIDPNPNVEEFLNFYSKYNGFSLAEPVLPKNVQKRPLLICLPVNQLIKFTEFYLLQSIPLHNTHTESMLAWLEQQPVIIYDGICIAGNTKMVIEIRQYLKKRGVVSNKIKAQSFWE